MHRRCTEAQRVRNERKKRRISTYEERRVQDAWGRAGFEGEVYVEAQATRGGPKMLSVMLWTQRYSGDDHRETTTLDFKILTLRGRVA